MVVNFSHEEIELPKATVLGVAEETSASVVAAINDEVSGRNDGAKTRRGVNTVVDDTWCKQYARQTRPLNSCRKIGYRTDFGKIQTCFP
jgi:hypothetical protein